MLLSISPGNSAFCGRSIYPHEHSTRKIYISSENLTLLPQAHKDWVKGARGSHGMATVQDLLFDSSQRSESVNVSVGTFGTSESRSCHALGILDQSR
jgi:hypothetical protein